MPDKIDWCQFVIKIQKDPKANIRLTVGQYYEFKKHVQDCDNCSNRVDMTLEKEPQKPEWPFGVN